MRLFNLNGRAVRTTPGPPLLGYPASIRRVIFWFDSLTDWQRVQYACIAILFLLACGGYLLGLGSSIVLARVEAEQAALAALPLPTVEETPTTLPALATSAPTFTPLPSATPLPPTPVPSATPFSAPVIAEPPAAPRVIPAAPVVVAPVAPRVTPTSKPRNVETSKPEPPAASVATSTPGLGRTVRPTPVTSVREAATAAATATPRRGAATPLPTLAATVAPAKTVAATTAPTRAAANTNTTPTTPIRTPAPR